MRVQDALANCCHSMQVLAKETANWGIRTVTAVGTAIADLARKGYAIAMPYFAAVVNFVSVNRIPVGTGIAGLAVGAGLMAAFRRTAAPQP